MLDINIDISYPTDMATPKFLMTLPEEDRLVLKWAARRLNVSMAEVLRLAIRAMPITASASGELNVSDINLKEFEYLVQEEELRQLERTWAETDKNQVVSNLRKIADRLDALASGDGKKI